ncbi:hypothetical protein GCM10009759_20170 [Kitasatospora saccharophila]|uniref:Lipoprotein n=1 Tax=Kitasatospora saccharophila TaxID=407973 RepID=A0ABN2WIT2_9ACTN
MTGRQPFAARALFATAALGIALTLAACDPDGTEDAAASPSAAPSTARPTASAHPGAPKSSPAVPAPPSTDAPPSRSASPRDPGAKHTLTEARTAGALTLGTGTAQLSDVPVDPGEMRDGMHLVEANYVNADGGSGRPVLFVGVDNVPEEPSVRREHLWRGLLQYAVGEGSTGNYGPSATYPAGPLGGNLECVPLDSGAMCGWVDSWTAAVALFPTTAPADAAEQFLAMREAIEH